MRVNIEKCFTEYTSGWENTPLLCIFIHMWDYFLYFPLKAKVTHRKMKRRSGKRKLCDYKRKFLAPWPNSYERLVIKRLRVDTYDSLLSWFKMLKLDTWDCVLNEHEHVTIKFNLIKPCSISTQIKFFMFQVFPNHYTHFYLQNNRKTQLVISKSEN